MSDDDKRLVRSGACRCGRYRFRVAAEPFTVSYCHCSDCRRATGALVTVFVGFRAGDVHRLGPEAAVHAATPSVERLFCGTCGTPVGYRDERLPGEIYYYLGIMDDPASLPPMLHAWAGERLPWLDLGDDLPRFEGFSRPR
jgi:hypothetical protein